MDFAQACFTFWLRVGFFPLVRNWFLRFGLSNAELSGGGYLGGQAVRVVLVWLRAGQAIPLDPASEVVVLFCSPPATRPEPEISNFSPFLTVLEAKMKQEFLKILFIPIL